MLERLTHLVLVSHICISESGQHWFRWWLLVYSVLSHYLNRCWVMVNRTLNIFFSFTKKCIWTCWKYRLRNGGHFVQGEMSWNNCSTDSIADWANQGWVSSGRNLFLPGHPEKSGRNLFLPVLSGQYWKKLDKTGKNYERGQKCWKKIITILNYLQKIIMIMVTNAFG